MTGSLGRKVPTDWTHVQKYPLSAVLDTVVAAKVPFAIGINWYSDFDRPVQVNFGSIKRWFVAKDGIKGTIRGGHCVCVKPGTMTDPESWWDFYNQGQEGACVGFGNSRMMSLLNRRRYNARWLWDQSKLVDEWAETNPGDDDGTSVNAALQVLAALGHVKWSASQSGLTWQQRDKLSYAGSEGVMSYRWAKQVDEVRTVLASPLNDKLQAVPFLNSWGRDYPHVTWMPYNVLQRLMDEDGEVAIVTDR
jgi:hypothetical protein